MLHLVRMSPPDPDASSAAAAWGNGEEGGEGRQAGQVSAHQTGQQQLVASMHATRGGRQRWRRRHGGMDEILHRMQVHVAEKPPATATRSSTPAHCAPTCL